MQTQFRLNQLMMMVQMDLYLIYRMFIKFDHSKMFGGPSGCGTAEQVKNIIIYVEDPHAEVYNDFFCRLQR